MFNIFKLYVWPAKDIYYHKGQHFRVGRQIHRPLAEVGGILISWLQ